MKNEHLVPVNVIDLAVKANDTSLRENERNNYILRLEAIRNYCELAAKKAEEAKRKAVPAWKTTREYCS